MNIYNILRIELLTPTKRFGPRGDFETGSIISHKKKLTPGASFKKPTIVFLMLPYGSINCIRFKGS